MRRSPHASNVINEMLHVEATRKTLNGDHLRSLISRTNPLLKEKKVIQLPGNKPYFYNQRLC